MSPKSYVVRQVAGQGPGGAGGAGQAQTYVSLLRHLDMELTERCNNDCLHCYINQPADDAARTARELTTAEWIEVLREAAGLGTLSVRFTGGEPLLRPDFVELYLEARRLGMKVILFTNARLITPALADLFARVPPLEKIEVSVYGMRPRSYDAVARVDGAYKEFQRGMGLLLERGIPFVVKSVLLPPNRDEMDEFEAWAATLPGMDGPPGYAVLLDLRTRRDSPAKNEEIRRLRFTPEETVWLAARRGVAYRKEMATFSTRFMGPPGDRVFTCGAGQHGCVDAYGAYLMCCMVRHPDTLYDLRGGSIRKAMQEVFPVLRERRATDPEYLRRCARCFLKGLCEQGPAKSWAEYGTLQTPVEYYCDVAHAQAEYLGLLGHGEEAWQVQDWRERLLRFALEEGVDVGSAPADQGGDKVIVESDEAGGFW